MGLGTRSATPAFRRSTRTLALQQDALKEAGCEKIFIEQMSGAVSDRPALREALDYARSGDTLIVWKLDRLARSMKQLIETIEKLRLRNIGFRSLTEAIDTTTAQGVLVFHMFSALAEFERALIRERYTRRTCRSEARGPNRRPTAEADRERSRHCEDVARQSRYYRRRCCRPSRGVARDAVSPPSRCANGECRRRLKMSAIGTLRAYRGRQRRPGVLSEDAISGTAAMRKKRPSGRWLGERIKYNAQRAFPFGPGTVGGRQEWAFPKQAPNQSLRPRQTVGRGSLGTTKPNSAAFQFPLGSIQLTWAEGGK